MISSLVPALISAFKARRKLALENVALRQQLAVLRRSVKRLRLSKVYRGFWVLLRRIWTDWESVLVIVKPETVVRWHRYRERQMRKFKSPGQAQQFLTVHGLVWVRTNFRPLALQHEAPLVYSNGTRGSGVF